MSDVTTPEAARMAEIVKANASLLKGTGFTKRRHAFNRQTQCGVVHVVNFWQHPKEPPAWTEVPGLRVRRYGTFRIDFGVYVPEITRSHTPRSAWINEYDCHFRRTIGQLQGIETGDVWWPLDDPEASTWSTTALTTYGLPWLERFSDHDAIYEAFEAEGPLPLGMSPAGPLDIAEMLSGLGRNAPARAVLEQYVATPVANPSHAEYLKEYLPKIGHADLVGLVRSEPRT